MLWRRLEKDGLIKVTSGHMLLFFLSFCPSLKKRSRLKIEKAVLMTRIAYLEVYSIVRCVSASHPHEQRSAATNNVLPNAIINGTCADDQIPT